VYTAMPGPMAACARVKVNGTYFGDFEAVARVSG